MDKKITLASSATVIAASLINHILTASEKIPTILLHIESHTCITESLIHAEKIGKCKIIWFDEKKDWTEIINENEEATAILFPAISHITGKKYFSSSTKENQITCKKELLFSKKGPLIIIDGCQLLPIEPITLPNFIDAFFFTAHKMYGPYGLSFCALSDRILKNFRPLVIGGNNKNILEEDNRLLLYPESVDIPSIYAFYEIIDWISENIYTKMKMEHLSFFTKKLHETIASNKRYHLISPQETNSIISFYDSTIHAHDLAEKILHEGKGMVRSGFLCGTTFFEKKNLPAVVRISLGIQNTDHQIENLAKFLRKK